MAIWMKKNASHDPWFSLHGPSIPVGEVLKLLFIEDSEVSSKKFPATIKVRRSKPTGDNHEYLMSLNCLDYLGSSK